MTTQHHRRRLQANRDQHPAYGDLIALKLSPKLWDIHAGIQGLVLNVAVLVIVSLFTAPMDAAHVKRFTQL